MAVAYASDEFDSASSSEEEDNFDAIPSTHAAKQYTGNTTLLSSATRLSIMSPAQAAISGPRPASVMLAKQQLSRTDPSQPTFASTIVTELAASPVKHVSNAPTTIQFLGSKRSYILFSPARSLDVPETILQGELELTFRMPRTNCELVRAICAENGFAEVHPTASSFNLQWTGGNIKPLSMRALADFQKLNHFPRSSEITRKDRLYHNVHRMQQDKGFRHFDFVPKTFILPKEAAMFAAEWARDKSAWIVKPAALSRGRGIFLVAHPSEVPPNEPLVVCKYLSRPLLVDGFKFDLRLYVAVTCFDPLRIYLYEEGLARFATAKFDLSEAKLDNLYVHLTNYSVNKRSANYVSSPVPTIEDYGNKWSLSALLQHLRTIGHDTSLLLSRIEDLIIKTIIAGELPVAAACRSFLPNPDTCFEVSIRAFVVA